MHVPLFEFGWAGVDFFFVLSGFIIAHSVGTKGIGIYAWHRFRRVLLPYWPIGLAFGLLYVLLPHVSEGDRSWNWLTTATLVPFGSPALSVAWTLQHELVFYLIFAAAWFSRQLWLLVVWAALCVIGWDAIPLKLINLEFLMGVIAYLVVRHRSSSPLLLLVALVSVAVWIFLGASRDQSVLLGLAVAIALPPMIDLERQGMAIPRSLTFLGDASYSLYLAHGIFISIVARLYPNLFALTLAGLCGGLVYYFAVERQILSRVPKNPPSFRQKPSLTVPAGSTSSSSRR